VSGKERKGGEMTGVVRADRESWPLMGEGVSQEGRILASDWNCKH
jgi:hypothetical protein